MSFEQRDSGLLVPASFAASRRKIDMSEIATTRDGRDITRGYVDPLQIQQPTDSVLQLRGHGDYTIYKELLRDDQVGSCFNQRRLAVIGKEWDIDPGDDTRASKKAAEHLREMLQHIGWDRVTDLMLYGVYYGYAAAEVMWSRDGSHITIDQIRVRDRRRFGFDGYGALRLKTFSQPDGEPLPDRKFWTFATGADHDDEPYGLGLAHWLYWPVFFKRSDIRYWLTFLERFGQPTAKGEYPSNAKPHEIRKLLDALEAISTDTGIAVPQGMTIGLLEAARSGAADYAALYDKMDAAIAKITLGQTASTQGTPGRLGNDKLQGDVRLDLIKADADLVCESFNRTVARWLTEYNYPGAKPPRVYRMVEPPEDGSQRAERDKKVYDMGFKPKLAYIQENYGEDWEERPALPPSPAPAPALVPGARRPQFAAAVLPPPQQMLERTRQIMEYRTEVWINQVRELLREVNSLEEFRDRLLELYPNLTLDQYADFLAEALAASHLAGRNEVVEERS